MRGLVDRADLPRRIAGGYGIFDVNGESRQWTYKATGQPDDHQLRVYGPGSDKTAPDETRGQRVELGSEVAGGVAWPTACRAGRWRDALGLDPLAVQLHAGATLPKKNSWAEPARTEHAFYGPVGPGVREVLVRATDRFGRAFSATWRRP